MSNKLYKGLTLTPTSFFSLETDETLDFDNCNKLLCEDVQLLTQMVEWQFSTSAFRMVDDLEKYQNSGGSTNFGNKLGQILEVYLPKDIKKTHAVASRFEWIFQDRVSRELKSWTERRKARKGKSPKYISQGWKRTVNEEVPSDFKEIMSLSSVCKQYCEILNNPFVDGFIKMKLVVGDKKIGLNFSFDKERFVGASKLCLPNVRVENNKAIFDFSIEYEYIYSEISPKYIVGVDVGISQYATVVVVDSHNETIVHGSFLSHRVHSLYNSIKASNVQIRNLYRKNKIEEVSLHRQANSRKKKQLAILAAQEIAEIAHIWDNAAIVVEDLSWISNTMQNGRWNRGELVKWIEHYSNFNGSRTFKVNAAYTSRICYDCKSKVSLNKLRVAVCSNHGEIDRDINAAANIALRFKKSLEKVVKTRRKAKKFTTKTLKRSPKTRETLKYPGVDRTKKKATPKRQKLKKKSNQGLLKEVKNENMCSATHIEDGIVAADGRKSSIMTLEKQHDVSYKIRV